MAGYSQVFQSWRWEAWLFVCILYVVSREPMDAIAVQVSGETEQPVVDTPESHETAFRSLPREALVFST